jgi:hypothetical protein
MCWILKKETKWTKYTHIYILEEQETRFPIILKDLNVRFFFLHIHVDQFLYHNKGS